MRAFTVKVRTAWGTTEVVEVRATGQQDAARKALWHYTSGAYVVTVNRIK